MSSTSTPPTVHRPRPSSRQTSGGLPTLFRIPNLNEQPQPEANVAAAPIAPAVANDQPPVSTTTSELEAAAIEHRLPATDAANHQPPSPPEPELASAPEPRYQRIDPSHSYGDLPELPPLDEPAGRSWMETVGSRLVLVLLFLAVATVAIMATRDVPPASRGQFLADDAQSAGDDTVHVAEAVLTANEPLESDRTSLDPLPMGSETSEIDVITPTVQSLDSQQFSPDSEQDLSQPAADDHEDEHEMAQLDTLEDEPSEELPAFPIPNLALSPPQGSLKPAATDTQDDSEVAEASVTEPADSKTAQDTIEPETQIASVPTTQAARTPSYQSTDTPNSITDWRPYVSQNPAVGESTSVVMVPQGQGQDDKSSNQFNYPTTAYAPSSLNPPQYPPYAAVGAPTGQQQQQPTSQRPQQQMQQDYQAQQMQAYQQQLQAQQQQLQAQQFQAQQQLQQAQQQQFQTQQQLQQTQQQQPYQGQSQVYIPGQGYVNQPQPGGYAPSDSGAPNYYRQPANPNQAPYVGQQPYVPSR